MNMAYVTPLTCLSWYTNVFAILQMRSERKKKFKESVVWATVFFLLVLCQSKQDISSINRFLWFPTQLSQ